MMTSDKEEEESMEEENRLQSKSSSKSKPISTSVKSRFTDVQRGETSSRVKNKVTAASPVSSSDEDTGTPWKRRKGTTAKTTARKGNYEAGDDFAKRRLQDEGSNQRPFRKE
jgi:hypothetical protein